MPVKDSFAQHIEEGYSFKGESITLGSAIYEGETIKEAFIKVPLKTLNRHGLIAGATGTGKTKTLQVLAENLSHQGIPVLLMDVKGDLSGLAKPSPGHPKIDERHEKIGLPFTPKSFPVEILSLSEQEGVRL
ncbi:MAG: helicase HerA-like domain-containing protein, partial [Flavobacteriaceae bacterium]|nr:helicase HerA-like domain-containing protein [Flavobacteriaceae bacterium]